MPPTSSLPPPSPLVTVSIVDHTVTARSGSDSARSATASIPMFEIMPVAYISAAQMAANTIAVFASMGVRSARRWRSARPIGTSAAPNTMKMPMYQARSAP